MKKGFEILAKLAYRNDAILSTRYIDYLQTIGTNLIEGSFEIKRTCIVEGASYTACINITNNFELFVSVKKTVGSYFLVESILLSEFEPNLETVSDTYELLENEKKAMLIWCFLFADSAKSFIEFALVISGKKTTESMRYSIMYTLHNIMRAKMYDTEKHSYGVLESLFENLFNI